MCSTSANKGVIFPHGVWSHLGAGVGLPTVVGDSPRRVRPGVNDEGELEKETPHVGQTQAGSQTAGRESRAQRPQRPGRFCCRVRGNHPDLFALHAYSIEVE